MPVIAAISKTAMVKFLLILSINELMREVVFSGSEFWFHNCVNFKPGLKNRNLTLLWAGLGL